MLAEYSEETMEVFQKTVQLNTGAKIPLIGLGTVAVDQNEEVIEAAVTTALEVCFTVHNISLTIALYKTN